MAFRSNGPVTLSLPPFRGATRQIILTALAVYLGLALVSYPLPGLTQTLTGLMVLIPDAALHGQIWMFATYPFAGGGLLSVAFALLSLWFFATSVEEERGARWLMDYFAVATAGGGLVASLIDVAVGDRFGGWLSLSSAGSGLWPFVLAVLVAFAYFAPEAPVRFNFVLQLKAKYLAAIYVLFYVATALRGGDRFSALLALTNAGCGYAMLRFAPRRGLRAALSEWGFGLRNAYYRRKRQRAAKKFTVYMKKQGKDVSLDKDGRYIDPMQEKRDPKDRSWMN